MLERRGFLRRCLTFLGFGASTAWADEAVQREKGGPESSKRVDAHYFDWHCLFWADPYTTDPRYTGKLIRGEHNRVLCNGVDAGAAIRYVTGPNGWVERGVKDENGNLLNCITDAKTGLSRLSNEPPLPGETSWQQRIQDAVGPDRLRYSEELATEILHGNVEYLIDESRREPVDNEPIQLPMDPWFPPRELFSNYEVREDLVPSKEK